MCKLCLSCWGRNDSPNLRAKLEDRKVKINGNKVALAISQNRDAQQPEDSGSAAAGGTEDRNMILVGNGRDRSLQTTVLSKPPRSHHHEICRPNFWRFHCCQNNGNDVTFRWKVSAAKFWQE